MTVELIPIAPSPANEAGEWLLIRNSTPYRPETTMVLTDHEMGALMRQYDDKRHLTSED